MPINPVRAGLAFGAFLALVHLCWSVVVAIGQAQKLTDHLFQLHFIDPPWHVAPFEVDIAIMLVGVAFGSGLLFGIVFAAIWNYVHLRLP